MELTGKTAIVTGASGSLGGSIAAALGRAGCDVVIHYGSNSHRAEGVAMEVRQAGRRAAIVQADLLAEGGIHKLFDGAAALGSARILINSAAVFGRTPVGSITAGGAVSIVHMDMLVPILASQEFAIRLRQQAVKEGVPFGKIVNIADVGAERPWKGYSVYCAAKAGLIAATKALAKELAPSITVNAIAPGLVTWPQDMDEAARQRQLSFIPAGRTARPEEVAAAVIFLLRNDYVTGQVINVDGGRAL